MEKPFGSPDEFPDWMKDLLIALLPRRSGQSILDPPEWFDDANPEPYLKFIDHGLISGMQWHEGNDGRTSLSIQPDVQLTPKGRTFAERWRREVRVSEGIATLRNSAFVSYVREDADAVNRLCGYLETRGIRIWRDTNEIMPGDEWKLVIRQATGEGAAFIACFSQNSENRTRSYMREELILALDELRQRPFNSGWFIPVLLSGSSIPNIPIGPGRSLADLHFVDLGRDFDGAAARVLAALERLVP